MAIQRTVVGSATSQDGQAVINTTKVSNTLVEETKLRFKLTAAADSTAANIVLMPGPARYGSQLNLDGKVTFNCTTGFSSYSELMAYFQKISTNCYGVIIQTTDTDNYQDNILKISERDPSGRVTDINIDLSDYRVNNGTSFSDKIVLEQSDFNQVFWPGSEIVLATLKPGTSMTFTFKLQGWNKVQELSAVRPNVIA